MDLRIICRLIKDINDRPPLQLHDSSAAELTPVRTENQHGHRDVFVSPSVRRHVALRRRRRPRRLILLLRPTLLMESTILSGLVRLFVSKLQVQKLSRGFRCKGADVLSADPLRKCQALLSQDGLELSEGDRVPTRCEGWGEGSGGAPVGIRKCSLTTGGRLTLL